ncbi:MAG: hypothetical protein OXF49_01255 [Candidatus Saccharibacteria bacterium]|nr:hypothetical protein [Candidatus Saccharibacteria bacterium]
MPYFQDSSPLIHNPFKDLPSTSVDQKSNFKETSHSDALNHLPESMATHSDLFLPSSTIHHSAIEKAKNLSARERLRYRAGLAIGGLALVGSSIYIAQTNPEVMASSPQVANDIEKMDSSVKDQKSNSLDADLEFNQSSDLPIIILPGDALSSYPENFDTEVEQFPIQDNQAVIIDRPAIDVEIFLTEDTAGDPISEDILIPPTIPAEALVDLAVVNEPSPELMLPAHNQSADFVIPKSERHSLLRQAGISQADWPYASWIINAESSWRPFVWNQQGSSAYGLCQSMKSVWEETWAADFMTNPVTQLKWCDWYAKDRYKSWQEAVEAWKQQNWW